VPAEFTLRALPLWVFLATCFALPLPAAAATLDVPLALDYRLVQQTLSERLFAGPGETAEMYADPARCNYLQLSEPRVAATGDARLRLRATMQAQTGTPVFGRCWFAKPWHGVVEIQQSVQADPPTATLTFRVVDTALLRGEDGEAMLPGFLERWIEQYVHPRLAAVELDLSPVVDGLQELLDLALAGAATDADNGTGTTHVPLRLASARAAPDKLVVMLALEIPDFLPPPEAAEEVPLTAEELARWDAAWQTWDAFATWTIKLLAASAEPELAQALADTLLAARYDLRDALARDQRGHDPVRELFLQTWERLAPLVQEVQLSVPGGQALPYAAFVSAGDALQALDRVAPQLGLRLDQNTLRRMARLLSPGVDDSALQYGTAIDPALRELLGLDPEFEEEAPLEMEDESESEGERDGGVESGDEGRGEATDEDSDEDRDDGSDEAGVNDRARAILAWLFSFVGEARAATIRPDLLRELDRWVPERKDVDRYLATVDRLLEAITDAERERGKVPAPYEPLYDTLLRATAWQESCWRQYVVRDDKVEAIRSPAGSVGLMQVNVHVWRGVYDPEALVANVGYNTRAGNEILVHYLVDYALRKGEHERSGDPDGLARAAYAAYNGGPSHLARYRRPNTPASLKMIDNAFLDKYRAIQAEGAAAVKRCLVG